MENNLQQYLVKQLYTNGSEIITKRVFSEIIKFNKDFDGTVEWRDQFVAILDTIHSLGKGLSVIEAVLLSILEDHWQELDQSWRDMYQDDIEVFAWKKYQRKPGTIRADLRAVRVFLLGDNLAKPFGSLEVPKRDVTGEIVKDESGKCLTERVEWDPMQATLAKLKVAVPVVTQGKATEKVWSMMMDDHVSSSQMVETIYANEDNDPNPPQLVIKYRLEGPILVAYENGTEVELGELSFEGYYTEPYSLKHRAMNMLLNALGLTLDEHVTLYRGNEEQYNEYYK